MADVKLYLTDMEERRRKTRKRLRLLGLLAGICALIGIPLWVVFQSPLLVVKEVRVNGTERSAPEAVSGAVRAAVAETWKAKVFGVNHLFAWPDTVPESAYAALPNIKTIALRKEYRSRSVTLTVTEREPFGIWCVRKMDPAKCFWFEADGSVFESAPEGEGKLIHVVGDYTRDSIARGEAVLPSPLITHLREVLEVVAGSEFAVKEIRYEQPELQELKVTTYEGPVLFFSLRFSPAFSVPVMDSLFVEDRSGRLSPRLGQLQYIDFRVENRAYYK